MKRYCLSAQQIIHNRLGFTIFEILLAMIILVIAIIPMVNAFAPSLLSTGQTEEQAVLTGQARSTMNRLLDLNFQTLYEKRGDPANLADLLGSAEEANKENFDYLGTTYTPVATICTAICTTTTTTSCTRVTDCVTGKSGLLELTVTLKNVKLQTLKAER
jgi:Tfp pilus assembly protein PilV